MEKLLETLKKVDVKKRLKDVKRKIDNKEYKNTKELDKLVREYKVLKALDSEGLTPYEAFTRQYVPVIPSAYRSPMELASGTLINPAINDILKQVGLANKVYNEAINLFPEKKNEFKYNLYKAVESLTGFEGPEINKEHKKNLFETIANVGPPKKGFFQRIMLKKRQNLSGRAVIAPDPTLDIDELSVPYKMAVKLYSPWIIKELKDRGYSMDEIKKEMDNLTDTVKDVMLKISKERPLLLNRPPTLWQGSVTAHYPILVDSYNIGIPNLLTSYQKADFDGDSMAGKIYIKSNLSFFQRLKQIIKGIIYDIKEYIYFRYF